MHQALTAVSHAKAVVVAGHGAPAFAHEAAVHPQTTHSGPSDRDQRASRHRESNRCSVEYYTNAQETAVGAESYYLGAVTQGEPPGVWLGRGAETLGLSGEVVAEDMHPLFNDFEHPHTGERVGSRPAVRKDLAEKVAAAQAAEPGALPERLEEIRREVQATSRASATKGWDATFAVPKSVSAVHTAAARGEITATRDGDLDSAEAFRVIREEIESAIADSNAAAIAMFESVAVARTGGGSTALN